MSYLDDEKSVDNAQPVELYRFDGTYASYYYTSGPKLVTYDSGDETGPHDYIPIAIERTEVKAGTQDDDALNITVKLPVGEAIVDDYAFTISPPKLKLTIYRQEPSGTIVYWIGPANNISVDEEGRAAVLCPSIFGTALVGNVPDVHYQTPCNHTLYDPRCGVDHAANSEVTTVTAISTDGKTISVGSIGTLDGKLIGGELALGTGEVRMIVAQTGTDLTVNYPFARIDLAGSAIIAAGCDYAYSGDCKHKFANQLKFGGFMFIPPINPFLDGIEPAADGVTDDACVFVHTPPETFVGEIILDFDLGDRVPTEEPSTNITMYRGGVQIAYIDGSFGYSSRAATGGRDGVGGRTLTMASGDPEPAYWTDLSFADGPPDHIHLQIQFGFGAFDCGGGPAEGCGGTARMFFKLPNVAAVQYETGGLLTFDIIRLWPVDLDFYP